MKSKLRSQWAEILGDPNGNEIGAPTDMRYATDTGILWVKSRGMGTNIGWVPISGPDGSAVINSIITQNNEQLTILTQDDPDAAFTALQIGTFWEQDVVVPALTTIILTTLIMLDDDGRTAMVDLKVTGVDSAVLADVSSLFQVSAWRRAAGATVPITAQELNKQTTGGAGTFSADVTIIATVAVGAPNSISLVAANAAAAPRTGHITANWTIQQGGAL